MGKRGRPKTGKTVSVRVPEEIHLMLTWVADAKRSSVPKELEELLAYPAVEHYLKHLDTIKKLKEIEDERAKIDRRDPLPLPRLFVLDPTSQSIVPIETLDPKKLPKSSDGKFIYRRSSQPGLWDGLPDDEADAKQTRPPADDVSTPTPATRKLKPKK